MVRWRTFNEVPSQRTRPACHGIRMKSTFYPESPSNNLDSAFIHRKNKYDDGTSFTTLPQMACSSCSVHQLLHTELIHHHFQSRRYPFIIMTQDGIGPHLKRKAFSASPNCLPQVTHSKGFSLINAIYSCSRSEPKWTCEAFVPRL